MMDGFHGFGAAKRKRDSDDEEEKEDQNPGGFATGLAAIHDKGSSSGGDVMSIYGLAPPQRQPA